MGGGWEKEDTHPMPNVQYLRNDSGTPTRSKIRRSETHLLWDDVGERLGRSMVDGCGWGVKRLGTLESREGASKDRSAWRSDLTLRASSISYSIDALGRRDSRPFVMDTNMRGMLSGKRLSAPPPMLPSVFLSVLADQHIGY
jgi:hypothetical protein